MISFSTKQAIASNVESERDRALLIADDGVTLTARTSVFVNVKSDAFEYCEAIAEGRIRLLFEKGICIARGFVQLQHGCTPVLLTNCSNERRHLVRGVPIAFLEEIADVMQVGALKTLPPDTPTANLSLSVDINRELPTAETEALKSLVYDFSGFRHVIQSAADAHREASYSHR